MQNIQEVKAKLLQELKRNEEWEKEQREIIKAAEEEIEKLESKRDQLQSMLKNRKKISSEVVEEVERTIKEMPFTQRVMSRKAALYKCIRNSLENRYHANIDNCKNFHPAKLEGHEEKLLQSWKDRIGWDEYEVRKEIYKIGSEIVTQNTKTNLPKMQLRNAEGKKASIQESLALVERLEKEEKLVLQNAKFLNCDANTPEISLEEKIPFPGADFQGPFFNVPRDNQDGLGTCYANTAKNLLVSASKGKDIASFLDLALVFKGGTGIIRSGLDGGGSCTTLERAFRAKFCPQKYSPIETGEKNPIAEGLMAQGNFGVYDQGIIVKLLHQFLYKADAFQKSNKELSEETFKKARLIIDKMKANPDLKLPLPVVRFDIPALWKLKETFALYSKRWDGTSEEMFMEDYQKQYRQFYPEYVKAVQENKNPDQIFELYTKKMEAFIEKYNLQNLLPQWKNVFIMDTKIDFDDPNLSRSFKASASFLRVIFGKESEDQACDNCYGGPTDSLPFLAELKPLLKHMSEIGLDEKVLLDDEGAFKDPHELMQLAVAPACLNDDNRVPFSYPLSCENGIDTIKLIKATKGTYESRKKILRSKILSNLLQGYAVGNQFGNHINTIVGMRFNNNSKRCEYLIRESQTGTSMWQDEGVIYDRIESLTEVRRK